MLFFDKKAQSLIFGDDTHLIAYGHNGIEWHPEDIALDDFKTTTIKSKILYGEFLN